MTPTEHNPQNFDATAQQQDRERERVVGVDASLQCCFCGARHRIVDSIGYAGERQCRRCGSGGDGEPDGPHMAYKGDMTLDLSIRLQLALERVGVKLTTGQVLLVAAEIGR